MQVEPSYELPIIADGEDKTSPLKNRIRKNYRHLRKWAKRTVTNCFRVYDREIPHYPLAIDFYAGKFCVQYFFKAQQQTISAAQTHKHLAKHLAVQNVTPIGDSLVVEIITALTDIFAIKPSNIYWRTRIKREKLQQYEKIAENKEFFTVLEYGVKFKVNLRDYLDTGLFLDHRETRHMVAALARNKRVLNLFAYTSAFSVHTAMAGAAFTKSVDMSNMYTTWGKDNFRLNGLSLKNNELVRADCLKFLPAEIKTGIKYDLIIIDPPTISRSKKMAQMFDIQMDYIFLITCSLELLAAGGIIFFSTNSLKFSFEGTYFPNTVIEEISHKTLPLDFRKAKIHRCWTIRGK